MTKTKTKHKIIIADDDEMVREHMEHFLRRYRNIEIQHAKTGEEALKKINKCIPDVLFTDMNFGEKHKNGIEICKIIKSDPRMSNIFIVMISGRGESQIIKNAMAAGVKEYLLKPWEPEQLEEICTSLGLRYRQASDAINKCGKLNRSSIPIQQSIEDLKK